MTAINHFPKILFITSGPFGVLGTTDSYMRPLKKGLQFGIFELKLTNKTA